MDNRERRGGAVRIVPSLLAETTRTFLKLLDEARGFAPYIQVDIMDGRFVPTKSFPVCRLNGIKIPMPFEVHLMVQNPAKYIRGLRNPMLRKIIFHIESEEDPALNIESILRKGLQAGLAIKPRTELQKISGFFTSKEVHTLLFLTVEPGNYGSPFEPEILKKVADARTIFKGEIGVDGGVSLENLGEVARSGADYASVGSRIFLSGNPAQNYARFLEELEKI